MSKSIYLAGPLFTAAELKFNLELCADLTENGYNVFLPQQECLDKTTKQIHEICKAGVDSSDVVVAIMDGADADSGTCWECGFATAKGIPVIIVRTDLRDSGDTGGFNAMIYFSAAAVIEERENYTEKILKALVSL